MSLLVLCSIVYMDVIAEIIELTVKISMAIVWLHKLQYCV